MLFLSFVFIFFVSLPFHYISFLSVHQFGKGGIIINLRHFTRYLNATGRRAFVPTSEYNVKAQRYRPYIFTDQELRLLFDAIDDIKPCPRSHVEWIAPVLFRMELCCGMRPNEPLNLLVEDVDLATGDIFIRKSKRGKDRHIIVSEDMRLLCAKYDQLAGKRKWFFQHWEGGKFPVYWARDKLTKAWMKTGRMENIIPRPYDLRHNFATRTLMRWIDEKRNVMALMPYL